MYYLHKYFLEWQRHTGFQKVCNVKKKTAYIFGSWCIEDRAVFHWFSIVNSCLPGLMCPRALFGWKLVQRALTVAMTNQNEDFSRQSGAKQNPIIFYATFSRVCHWLQFFPHLPLVSCFSARVTGFVSRAYHRSRD